MKYEVIIFDFFGVICSEVAPFWLRRYFSEADAEDLKDGIIHEADLGKVSQQELFIILGEKAQLPANRVEAEWWSLAQINRELLTLLPVFAARYRLGLLTNTPSPLFRRILSIHEVARYFKVIIVSSEVGIAKPDKSIYELILTKIDTLPGQALMIDDNPVNIAAARATGMEGLLYTSAAALARTLL